MLYRRLRAAEDPSAGGAAAWHFVPDDRRRVGRVRYPSLEVRGVTVAQFPNPPLIVALVAALVSWMVGDGSTYEVARAIFYVALTVWAWEEASRGVNGFRKVLGVGGLIFVVVSLTSAA
jgi:hypothetical protein